MSRKLATKHEDYVADVFSGVRSRTSGASIVDKGDVRVKDDRTLFECKYSGSPGQPRKSKSKIVRDLEKVADEASDEGLEPALALRFYDPDSSLASKQTGYVDVVVRLIHDDARRSD